MNPRKPIPSKIKAYAFFSLFMPFYICRCSPNPLCLIGTYPLTPGDDTSSSISNNPIYQDAPENTKLFMYPHPQHPLSFPSYLYQERCQKVSWLSPGCSGETIFSRVSQVHGSLSRKEGSQAWIPGSLYGGNASPCKSI